MSDPTLGGFLPTFEPVSEAEEAAHGAYVNRHFPPLRERELSREERLADLAGSDVAELAEGETVEGLLRRHRMGGFR
jgi:hypothetical protein